MPLERKRIWILGQRRRGRARGEKEDATEVGSLKTESGVYVIRASIVAIWQGAQAY